jgi:hypothetical protein
MYVDVYIETGHSSRSKEQATGCRKPDQITGREKRDFSLYQPFQTFYAVHKAFYLMGNKGSSYEGEASGARSSLLNLI